jgi:hypothetical protein
LADGAVELSRLGLWQSFGLLVAGAGAEHARSVEGVEELGDGDGGGSGKIGQPFRIDLKPVKDIEKFMGEERVYIDNY